jgi:hypothetical protein
MAIAALFSAIKTLGGFVSGFGIYVPPSCAGGGTRIPQPARPGEITLTDSTTYARLSGRMSSTKIIFFAVMQAFLNILVLRGWQRAANQGSASFVFRICDREVDADSRGSGQPLPEERSQCRCNRLGQCRRRCLQHAAAITIDNADVRLFHRHIQSGNVTRPCSHPFIRSSGPA